MHLLTMIRNYMHIGPLGTTPIVVESTLEELCNEQIFGPGPAGIRDWKKVMPLHLN